MHPVELTTAQLFRFAVAGEEQSRGEEKESVLHGQQSWRKIVREL
jgi:hypothetical protein